MAKQGIKLTRLAVALNVTEQSITIHNQKRNGEVFENVESATYNFKDLPLNIQTQVSLYGLNKLLQDRTSQLRKETIPLSEVMIGIAEVYATLLAGNWSATRKASAKAENDDAVLIAVVAENMGKPVAVVAAMFAKLDQAKKKALAEKFADQVKAAKEAAEENADDFFGDLGDDE